MWPNGHTVYFLRGLCPIGYAVGIGVDVMRKVFEAIADVVERGELGGTFNFHGRPVRYGRGYQVGLYGHEIRFNSLASDDEVFDILEWLEFVRPDIKAGAFVGLWKDTETGEYCLDVSVYIAERERAIHWGRINAQKAIWDWERGESVAVV